MGKRVVGPAEESGVRAALIENLSTHERVTVDPRWHLVPRDRWPDPLPPCHDPIADMYDRLVAGEQVDVPRFMVSRLAEIPSGVHRVRVAPDGTLSPTPR